MTDRSDQSEGDPGFAELVSRALERRKSASAVLEAAEAQVEAARRDVTAEELSFNTLCPRLICPVSGSDPIKGSRIRHDWWHDEDGEPVEKAKFEVTIEQPFRAAKTEIDYDHGTVTFSTVVSSFHDHGFSQSGHKEWLEVQVPIDQLEGIVIEDITED